MIQVRGGEHDASRPQPRHLFQRAGPVVGPAQLPRSSVMSPKETAGIHDEEDEGVEIEDHLQECPKCSGSNFGEDRAEFNDPPRDLSLSYHIKCHDCGFAWQELYEFKYSWYEGLHEKPPADGAAER
jgi:hypothetical protein